MLNGHDGKFLGHLGDGCSVRPPNFFSRAEEKLEVWTFSAFGDRLGPLWLRSNLSGQTFASLCPCAMWGFTKIRDPPIYGSPIVG